MQRQRIEAHSTPFVWSLFLLTLTLGLSIVHTQAQETMRESFAAGDSSTNLLVYDSLDDIGHVNSVRDAVIEAMDSFDALFDDPVTIPEVEALVTIDSFVGAEASRMGGSETWTQSSYEVVGDPDFIDVVGDHIFFNSSICYVEVDDFVSDNRELQFEIAHEIARCFLANRFSDMDIDYGSNEGWLVESLAEWLATVVYPTDASIILSERAGFNELLDIVLVSDTILGDNGLVTNIDYAAVYFWMYLSSLEGDAVTPSSTANDVLNLLRNYTGLSYEEDFFHPYLDTEIENLPDQFSSFGVALATESLAGQPPSTDLFDTTIPTDIPMTDTVSMDSDFSLRFRQFSTFIDVPAIEVSVSGLPEDSSVRVQVSGDEISYQMVNPDASVVLCKDDDEILLNSVVSRAYEGEVDSDITFEIIYEPLEEYEDCEEPEPDLSSETERGDGTSCLVGNFELVDLPAAAFSEIFGDLVGASDISVGTMNLTIDEGLNVTHAADDFSVNMDMSGMQMVVNIDIAVSGHLDVVTTDGVSFAVESFTYSFDSISATATIDDQTMDLSDLASDMVSEFGNAVFLPPVQLACTDFGLNYHASLNGVESIWGYHGLDTAPE